MSHALEGLKVLDLTEGGYLYAARLLADLGAQVTMVEPPGGSPLRRHPALFAMLAANKTSVVVDLESETGRSELMALARRHDVLCESFARPRLRALDLDPEAITREIPSLVWASLTPFGTSGPRRDWKSSNLIPFALCGNLHAIGDADRAPLAPAAPLPLAELMTALHGATGILAAVRMRRKTGRGQLVDVSAQATMVASACELGVNIFLDDLFVRRRVGNRRRQIAPTGLYRCQDGYASIVILPLAHWVAMAKWLHEKTGNEAVLDPMFHEIPTRVEMAEMLESYVEELALLYTKQEIFEEGQRRGISITPVNRLEDVLADPHLAAREWWHTIDDPVLGKKRVGGAPYRLSATPWKTGPAPKLA